MTEPNEDYVAEIKVEMVKSEEPLEIFSCEVVEEPLEIVCSDVIDKVIQKHYESAEASTSGPDTNKDAALFVSNKSGKVSSGDSASTSRDWEYFDEKKHQDKLCFDTIRPTFVDCGASGGNVQVGVEVGQASYSVRHEKTVSESYGNNWSDDSCSEENAKCNRSGSESDTDNEDGDSDSEGREEDGYVSVMNAANRNFMYMPSWKSNSECMRNLEFGAENKILVPYPVSNKPVDWFTLFMDDFLNLTIEETNSSGNKRVRLPHRPGDRPKTPSSRSRKRPPNNWTPLQLSELKLFVGILLHMGTVKCNRIKDYWCIDPIFGMKYIRERMVSTRFSAILRELSFSKESSCTQAKLLVSRFNDIMARVYHPDRDLVVEEGVMMWKGLKSFEGSKGLYKLYSLSESAGPVVKMIFSESRKRSDRQITIYQTAIIKRLMEDKCSGHSLVVNNEYLGFTMAKELLQAKAYCTGFLSPNSQEIPAELKQTKLKDGETAGRYADGVMIGKWRKNHRESYYVSTEFENTMVVSTSEHGKCREMPLPILKLKFKENMHVAEVTRPLMDYYPTVGIQSLPWHKRIFLHLLQIMMLNAHKLYNLANLTQDREPMEFHRFRVQVIRELMGTNQFKASKRSFPEPCYAPEKKPNTGTGTDARHPLAKIMVKTKDGKRTSRRRCRMCAVEHKFSQTIYMCAQCPGQPALCAIPCFDKYHTV